MSLHQRELSKCALNTVQLWNIYRVAGARPSGYRSESDRQTDFACRRDRLSTPMNVKQDLNEKCIRRGWGTQGEA